MNSFVNNDDEDIVRFIQPDPSTRREFPLPFPGMRYFVYFVEHALMRGKCDRVGGGARLGAGSTLANLRVIHSM